MTQEESSDPGPSGITLPSSSSSSSSSPSSSSSSSSSSPSNEVKKEDPIPSVAVPEEDLVPDDGVVVSFFSRGWQLLKDQWFLCGIACAILFAYLFPSLNTKVYAPIFQKYIAVPIIFFNCGLTLKTNELKKVMTEYKRVHAYIQSFSLGFIPITMYLLMKLLGSISDSILHNFREGFVVLGALPTTIAMQVILTTKSKGNVTVAVVGAALGNLLGIFVTPVYLFFLIDREEGVSPPITTILLNLLLSVFVPLLTGQLVRTFFPAFLRNYTNLIKPSTVNCFILIFMVWTSFSKTFNSDMSLGWSPFLQLVTAASILYCTFFGVSFLFTSLMKLPPSIRVPVLFGSTQKTISIGIPFINILFEGDPSIGFYSLPLLFYHPFQLIFGSIISSKFRDWVIRVEGEDEEDHHGVTVIEGTPAREGGKAEEGGVEEGGLTNLPEKEGDIELGDVARDHVEEKEEEIVKEIVRENIEQNVEEIVKENVEEIVGIEEKGKGMEEESSQGNESPRGGGEE